MNIRACVFKNCENYINLKDRSFNSHITLFNFPKNPERRQKWIENGHVATNLPASMYYFCSDHFDRRFFAVNNRRTVLVGEAVPFPYVDEVMEETYDENLDYYLYEMKDDGSVDVEEDNRLQEQNIQVESTSMLDEDQKDYTDNSALVGECVSNQYEETDQVKDSSSSKFVLNTNKHKLNDSTAATTSKSKVLKIILPSKQQSPPEKTLNNTSNTRSYPSATLTGSEATNPQTHSPSEVKLNDKEPEIDPDSLVDTQHVTTFIFKGEEYVQMPKDHYIKEKIDLVKKLQKMERIVKTIKDQLNSLEI